MIRLKTTRISKKETKVKERENIKSIETRPETIDVPTRSESVSHESKANFDPDPPSSDPSDDSSSSSDSTRRSLY